jgi:hypothetical protein
VFYFFKKKLLNFFYIFLQKLDFDTDEETNKLLDTSNGNNRSIDANCNSDGGAGDVSLNDEERSNGDSNGEEAEKNVSDK